MSTTAASASRIAVLAAATAFTACGWGRDPEPAPLRPATVDERKGTYRGVGIGTTRADARRELGRVESGPTDPLAPIGVDADEVGVPPSPRDPGGPDGIAIWRFERAVMAAGGGRAWLLSIAADDAVTAERVGVGSTLDDVRAAYRGMDCGTVNENTEYPQFVYCTVRVAPERYLFFAYDPVRSITMSTEPLL